MAKRSQLPKSSSGTQSGQSSSRSSAGSSRWVLLGVIAAVAVLASGLILVAVQATKKPIEATDRIGDGMAWGPAGAPVTILDFSDFGCSHCGTFALNQGERLRAEYEQTGKVRFEFKPFVLNWDTTAAPANAAACAAEQGKFWDYHDALFVRQGSSSQAFAPASLKAYAAELGLDATSFNRCVDQKEQYGLLQDIGAEARARGVNATPTFFVNDKKIEGAAAYEVFQDAIDQALAAAQ
jgi:protein-disulfide isomerase